jgi:hypothetical protein
MKKSYLFALFVSIHEAKSNREACLLGIFSAYCISQIAVLNKEVDKEICDDIFILIHNRA